MRRFRSSRSKKGKKMTTDPKKNLVDGQYTIRDLVDLKKLRGIFQHFTDTMGFTIGFLSVPDMEILIATGWRDICTKFHRRCPISAENCRRSNVHLTRKMNRPGRVVIEACGNGLVDCAMPIFIKGKCVAILATGQVLLKPPNLARFRRQAKVFGCNEKKYLAALAEVPVIPAKRLKQVTGFLKEMASLVAELGYIGLKEREKAEELARDIEERRKTESILRETTAQLQALQDAVADGFIVADIRTQKIRKTNPSACRMFGYSEKEFLNKRVSDLHPVTYLGAALRQFRKLAKGKRALVSGLPCLKKNGAVFFADITSEFMMLEGRRCLVGFFRDITERKLAEDKVKKSLSLERATLESTADGILVVDSAGKVADFNKRFAQLWNIPNKILRRRDDKKLLKYVLPQLKDREAFHSKVAELYRHPRKNSFDVLEFKDGRIFERYSHPQLVDGKPVGRVWSFRDVTDRKQGEEALQESKSQLNLALRSARMGVWQLDVVKNKRYFDAQVCRLLGLDLATFSGTAEEFFGAVHCDDRAKVKAALAQTIAKKVPYEPEYRVVWPDKSIHYVSARGKLACDRARRPWRINGVIWDVTEQKKDEEALKESQRQLRQIIDAVPHMIFAKDKEGRFLLVNRAVAMMYDEEPNQIIGKRRLDIHPVSEEAKKFLEVDRQVLATGKPMLVSNEFFTDVRARKHILQTIKIPFRMAGMQEECILGVSVDVTEQKRVEEFRNEIVRTVSHELRTPLSIEKEGISLLMDEMIGPVNMKQKEILGTVMRSIDRLARMITSLLDISSIETGKIQLSQKMTDLTDLVKDVAFEFRKRADEKNIDLGVELPGYSVQVLADPDKITQVLSNLVDNAIKFTPAKGVVKISLAVLKDAVECEVRDTGIGIASENLGKLCEKFQQFSRTAGPGEKGFGLGLSIAKGIIELHGGRIWIKSELGKGTRAMFSLPFFQKKKGSHHG